MNRRHLAVAVLVTAIWGLNFSIIKLGLRDVDPFVLAALRFALCAFPAVLFVPRPQVPWSYVVAYGLFFGVGVWGVVNLSITAGLSAGIASLLLQCSALFTVVLGAVAFRERLHRWQWAGILVAAAGLALATSLTDGTVSAEGVLLILFAGLSWSVSNLIVKRSRPDRMLAFLLWSSLFAPLPLLLLDVAVHGWGGVTQLPAQLGARALGSLLFQVYPVTVFGYWVWNSLMARYPVSTVAPLSLLVPFFGLGFSALISGEQISLVKAVVLALIVGGVATGIYGPRLGRRWQPASPSGPCPVEPA